jgi:hypothetical protein
MEPSPVLVAIREDLAAWKQLLRSGGRGDRAMAELHPLVAAALDATGELAEEFGKRSADSRASARSC